MKRTNVVKLTGVAGKLLLAFVFVFLQTAWARQKTKDSTDSASKASAPQPAEKQSAGAPAKAQSSEAGILEAQSAVPEENASGGPHEGIKVHGHWIIEVRNPDGTLVTRREFENSLHPGGVAALSSILARTTSPGFWQVVVDGSQGSQPCVQNGTLPSGCAAVEPASGPGFPANGSYPTLKVSAPTTGANSGQLVLTGTVTAQATAGVALVFTQNMLCSPNVAPATPCQSGNFSIITSATIPSIAVSAGQIIQVTVTISFS